MTIMDISDTLAPKSDQLDAVDLMGNPPRIFTVTKVDVRKTADQPVSVHLAEFPRVWRPGKSMRRVLAYCWGKDSAGWTDHRVELYCDERVRFGGEEVGGTRISRLSHIDGPKSVPLIVGKDKSGTWKVEPLTTEDIVAALRNEWKSADPERKKAIEAEVAALTKSSGAGAAPEATASAPVEPTSSPAPDVPLCPECRSGKCVNCSGQAWDNAADEPTDCGCGDASHGSKS